MPSALDSSRLRGSCVVIGPGVAAEDVDGRAHVLGVERAGDLQRADPGLGRRVGREGGQLLHRAGGDDLAGAVDVGGGEAVPGEGFGDLGRVAAEDGAHAGRA